MNKNIKIFLNYFLAPLLFAWLVFSIYHQIKGQENLSATWLHIKASFSSPKIINLLLVILLMIVNWGLEARKWQHSVASIHRLGFLQSFKATLSGVSFSVTMPNRVGEYLGRIAYMPEGNRLKTISVTLVASISQLWVTLVCGTAGFMFLKDHLIRHQIISEIFYRIATTGFFVAILFLTLIYFRISFVESLFERRIRNRRYLYLIQSLRSFNVQLLLHLLLLSFLRYLVFLIQYYLLFSLFDIELPLAIICGVVSVLFLILAVVPSIALVEIGLRGEVSLQLMGMFTANTLGVGLAAVSIWFINLVLPAIVGSILFLGIKVFKRRNEHH